MQKVKTFFHILSNSLLPQANYYHKLLKTPFSFSRKYFTFLVFVVNTVFAILLFVRLQSSGLMSLKDTVPASLQNYPDDLSVMIHGGMLHTNSDKPYFHWVDVGDSKRLVAVIDESADPEKIEEYDSVVLFTSQNAIVKQNGTLGKIPYGNRDVIVDKGYVEGLRKNLQDISSMVSFFGPPVLLLIAPVVFLIFYAIYFLVVTVLVFIPFKLFVKKIRFFKSFQISLHAGSFPIIIDYALCLFKPQIAFAPMIHLVFFGLTVLFIFAGIYEAYLDPVTRSYRSR